MLENYALTTDDLRQSILFLVCVHIDENKERNNFFTVGKRYEIRRHRITDFEDMDIIPHTFKACTDSYEQILTSTQLLGTSITSIRYTNVKFIPEYKLTDEEIFTIQLCGGYHCLL
jgi:hypothetical protein